MSRTTFVYALIDPTTGETRYIGRTADIGHREACHKWDARNGTGKCYVSWLKSLLDRGLWVRLVVLEGCVGDGAAEQRRHIASARRKGVPILNRTDGGSGVIGLKMPDAAKAKMRAHHRSRGGRPRLAAPPHRPTNYARGPRGGTWKGEMAGKDAGRARARTAYALGDCERCGRPAKDRHHKDGNTLNNDPANVAILCRRCHMAVDGRLDDFTRLGKAPKPHLKTPITPCVICGQPYKPLRKGRCSRCSSHFRLYGVERPTERRPITHCPRGHEYTPKNTRIDKKGVKNCRACRAEDGKRQRAEAKLAKAARLTLAPDVG